MFGFNEAFNSLKKDVTVDNQALYFLVQVPPTSQKDVDYQSQPPGGSHAAFLYISLI